MPSNNLLKELKELNTKNEFRKYFENIKFPNDGNSNFFDETIVLYQSGNILSNYKIKLDGVLDLYFRLILYLKFSRYLGNIPIGHGEYVYASNLHSILKEISKTKKIERIDEIDSEILDDYIRYNIEIKGFEAPTIIRKIHTAFETLSYGIKLPYFLQTNENLYEYSKRYKKLVYESNEIMKHNQNNIGEKVVYSLKDMKTLISDAINYVELYKDECLEMARFYKSIVNINVKTRYNLIYKKFKESNKNYNEPTLKQIQDITKYTNNVFMSDGYLQYIKDNNLNNLNEDLILVVSKLEACCISIALMMTGMRREELVVLDRNLNIIQDEHFELERIVYKTAPTKYGEPLTMPIPKICKDALEILSELAQIKDGNKKGNLIVSSIEIKDTKQVSVNKINTILKRYCNRLNLPSLITPHHFRHAIAYLITHINESEGLELARLFLGHKSVKMTLQYMAYYNDEIKQVVEELRKSESEQLVDKITEYSKYSKLFGKKANRLMPNHRFVGKQVDEFFKLLRKGLLQLIEENKLGIIQTPIALCIHDLSKPEELACQRGFNIENIFLNGPEPSNCKGANCSNAIFFEEYIEKLKNSVDKKIEPHLKERLEKNIYFMEAGGFEQEPFIKLIKEYDNYKDKGVS